MIHAREDYNRRIQDSENLIPDDEPVFLIRGQDIAAFDTIMYYAATIEDARADADLVMSIRNHALKMKKWIVKKIPDLPKETEVEDIRADDVRADDVRADEESAIED